MTIDTNKLRRLADFHEGKNQYSTTVDALRDSADEIDKLHNLAAESPTP